jgi:hypothetical protein
MTKIDSILGITFQPPPTLQGERLGVLGSIPTWRGSGALLEEKVRLQFFTEPQLCPIQHQHQAQTKLNVQHLQAYLMIEKLLWSSAVSNLIFATLDCFAWSVESFVKVLWRDGSPTRRLVLLSWFRTVSKVKCRVTFKHHSNQPRSHDHATQPALVCHE